MDAKKTASSMRTPLSRVIGLGSAHSGTELFWRQRLTAIANIALISIFVIVLLTLSGKPYGEVVMRLSSPLVSTLILAMLVAMLVHMRIGMQEIIDDYAHGFWHKPLLILNIFFPLGLGLASTLAVVKLALGG